MDYKEKYEQALAKAKDMLNYKEVRQEDMEYLFPELKESEDEKIRKYLIGLMKEERDTKSFNRIGINNDKIIAWLEKQGKLIMELQKTYAEIGRLVKENYYLKEKQGEQKSNPCGNCGIATNNCQNFPCVIRDGEQKSVDKVEPKFKVGDLLINPRTSHIIHIKDVLICDNKGVYELENSSMSIKNVEDNFRLWTIQDAKDGDILCCESGWTCIFKTLNSDNISFSSYCFMDNTGWFCEIGCEGHTLDKAFIKAYNGNIYPATKEQRDLLFQKMKEAGYEWDAEKKELKKISQEYPLTPDECIKPTVFSEQKPVEWSEEEEKMLDEIYKFFDTRKVPSLKHAMEDYAEFIKSLKDKVQPQPKQEWKQEKKKKENKL